MTLATFLAGCVIGALCATLLPAVHRTQLHQIGAHESDGDFGGSLPLSLSDAVSQIRSGWTRPMLVAFAVLRHPGILIAALAPVLCARKYFRALFTRPYPSVQV